jgi:hypothetical protein
MGHAASNAAGYVDPPEDAVPKVHAYLKTSLFHFDREGPVNVWSLTGDLQDQGNGGITLKVTSHRDDRGRDVEAPKKTVFIPWGKLDHFEWVGK